MASKRKKVGEFWQTQNVHRARLGQVVNKQALPKMHALYKQAQAEVAARLRASLRGQMGNTFTGLQQRMVLAQLREGQAQMARLLAGKMGPLTEAAQAKALEGLIEDIQRLSRKFTGATVPLPIEEAARFQGVIDKRKTSLLKMTKTSFARYGAHVVEAAEKDLSLGLLAGKPTHEVIDEVTATIDGEWWQGERIVRTETAWAFNASHADGIADAAEEIPELMMRWEEHCDDAGRPLDERVAVDSIAMHGQVARPGSSFVMPPTSPFPDAKGKTEVPWQLVGMSWEFPPNRPNDRSVLSPWMPDWGIPGWVWRGGRRVPL